MAPSISRSYEQQRDWILSGITGFEPETFNLADDFANLHGRFLAQDIASTHPLPLWENSAMDGYAVRSIDTIGAPVELDVVGVVPAGSSADPRLLPGQSVRIMTGAPLPTDADAVVKVENTSGFAQQRVRIDVEITAGKNVRSSGEDREAGALVARAGEQLTAARLSAAAAAGAVSLSVYPLPKVAVLVTGAELKTPGKKLERGQIPESNSLLISGLLVESGIQPATVKHCVDEPAAVKQILTELGATHDVVISTGGVGPGEYDVMRQVLVEEPQVQSVRVRLRPGAPQCAGRLTAGAMIFALPGNPVSAAVGFELFIRPALRAMQGAREPLRPVLRSTAVLGWKSPVDRLQVLPVAFDASSGCAPAVKASQISHSVGGFGSAQGYALIPEGTGAVEPGDSVEVIRLHS